MNFPLAPPQASQISYFHDFVFYALVGLTVFFTVLVYLMVIIFAVKYRQGNKVNRHNPIHENLPLEITWTVIPTFLGLAMFFFGAKLFIEMRTSPKNAEDVYVIGKQWMWHLEHSNGVRENNTLHVPLGRPVRLTLISQDVIHAFYVPAMRQQIHVVPGRYTTLWFTPSQLGKFPFYCGMYCGTQHSEMGGMVYVMQPEDYQRWLNNGGNNVAPMSMEERGARLFKVLACDNCHQQLSTERAPSLYNIYNSQRNISGGGHVTADEAYLRESILKPGAQLTAGYGPTMPEYDGQVSEEDVLDLIAYIKSLNNAMPGSVALNEAKKGSAADSSAGSQSVQSATAIGHEESTSLGDTNLSETGAAVNAVAAENRTERR